MGLQLYEPTEKELDTLTLEDYYNKNKEKFTKEDNILLEDQLVFELNSNNFKTPAFITKNGYVVVGDWDMVSELLMSPIPPKTYISEDNTKYEYPILLVPGNNDMGYSLVALHPNANYEPKVKKLIDDMGEETLEYEFKNYNYPKEIKNEESVRPKIK